MDKASAGKDLAATHPALALEAHGWDPSGTTRGSDISKEWKCSKGHIWTARVSDRATGSGKCPICLGKRVLVGFNDLATVNPKLAGQANGWDPTTIPPSSNKRLPWICPLGHEWTAKPSDRTSNSSDSCPICVGKRVLAGFNDLATTHPDLATEALGWDPSTVQAGSKKNLAWKCANQHEWSARVSSRALQGSGCRQCGNRNTKVPKKSASARKILPSVYDSSLELASEAYGWDPKDISIGSNRKMFWKCHKGHIWEANVNSRSKGRGCPICSGKKIEFGINDLQTLDPKLASQALGWDPAGFAINSNKSVAWKCEESHVWVSRISSRSQGKGCPYCAGNLALAGFNDLETTHPEISFELFELDPKTLTAGSEKKAKWRCPEGHIYTSTIKDRSQGHGCPSCAKTGFDQTKEGWFYLLFHPNWGLMQLGITNVPKKRIAKHRKLGWEVIEIAGPMNGLATRELETKSLRYLKQIGAQSGVENVAGKFDGYSESWFESILKVKSISELKDLTKNV